RAGRAGEELEAEDEGDRSDQVDEEGERLEGGHDSPPGRRLNISSIRSVTTKPPTTLMVPRITPSSASTMRSGPSAEAATSMAPTTITPCTALAPDISGVCSMVGTLLTTSYPTKAASTRMNSAASSANELSVVGSM